MRVDCCVRSEVATSLDISTEGDGQKRQYWLAKRHARGVEGNAGDDPKQLGKFLPSI